MKEAIQIRRLATGKVIVTLVLTDDQKPAVRWSVRTYQSQIKAGLEQARSGAQDALNQLEEA